jgi:arylsulfatase A-like enzyme
MKALGYRTGMFGKWHLGAKPEFHPQKRGFEEFFGFLGGGHPYVPGAGLGGVLRGILRGTEPAEEREYLTDALAREAAAFIARHKDVPFFLYLPFNAVHAPLESTPRYLERFPGIPEGPRRTHAAMLSALDDGVGRVLAELRRAGLEDDTLVIFLGDNGGPTSQTTSSNAPLRGFKGQVLEGGIRVPFLMQWRGQIPAGRVEDRPVSSLDLHATAVAAAGRPHDPDWKLDGVDLLPFVAGGRGGRPHDVLYWRMGANQRAVRAGDLKWVRSGPGPAQLFDLSADPSESRNLTAEKPGEAARLEALWQDWSKTLMEPRWGPAAPGAKPGGLADGAGRERLAQRFEALDKNGDGVLTADEAPNKALFEQWDADKDGRVTRREILEYFRTRRL